MSLSYSFFVESYFAIIHLPVFLVFVHPAPIGSCPVRVYRVPHSQWSVLEFCQRFRHDIMQSSADHSQCTLTIISAVLTYALRQGS